MVPTARRPRNAVTIALAALLLLGAGGLAACAPPPDALVIGPSDAMTVADDRQLTGRRLNLPRPDCTARLSDCFELNLINHLDGFDLDPRVTVRFNEPIDVNRVNDSTVYLHPVGDDTAAGRIGLRRLVLSGTVLSGQPERQLLEATRYEIVVTDAINGQSGSSTFTTMTATRELREYRRQLDSGAAYDDAGIPADQRGLDFVIDGERRVYEAANVLRPLRFNDLEVGDDDPLEEETVFDSSRLSLDAGTVAFGSFLAPQWIDDNRAIARKPSRRPVISPASNARVGFILITPEATPARPQPADGWPVAIFGPGVTRSKYDVFLAADENLRQGIATIAIDPVGHSRGPATESGVELLVPPTTERFSGFGRAVDVEGDGEYGDRDGLGTKTQPSRYASINLRDGLRQTALDNMALARAVTRGVDIEGDGTVDLRDTDIGYYAQSLGGIYGTMLMGTDPLITFGALNVPGGPILEIARLSPGFRCEVTTELGNRRPSLLNGGNSGCADERRGFTESTPLFAEPPETSPAPGAVAIQEVGARTNWINRSGSPEAFAPLIRLRPPTGEAPKRVMYQYAFGDETVPNPTSATIMRAGEFQDVTTFYRNDLTPTATTNPHGFLIDPRLTGRQSGQRQIAAFLESEGATIIDPDDGGPVFEVPITDPDDLEELNF